MEKNPKCKEVTNQKSCDERKQKKWVWRGDTINGNGKTIFVLTSS